MIHSALTLTSSAGYDLYFYPILENRDSGTVTFASVIGSALRFTRGIYIQNPCHSRFAKFWHVSCGLLQFKS